MHKALTIFIQLLPVISFCGTLALWADTRYMHKDMSDARHLELQIEFYDRQLTLWDRRIDKEGYSLNSEELREYELFEETIKRLKQQRLKILGFSE